jgi:hypothetical protein
MANGISFACSRLFTYHLPVISSGDHFHARAQSVRRVIEINPGPDAVGYRSPRTFLSR